MLKICSTYTERSYNTILLLLKEFLTEDFYTLEYDKIFLEKDFDGNHVNKLNYLLEKIRSLYYLRGQVLSFLPKVYNREVFFFSFIYLENIDRNEKACFKIRR